MINAITAGKMENNSQTISLTEGSSVIVTMVSPVVISWWETSPAQPSSKAIKLPEIAPPNFCAIVPDEKMSPVELVPFFSVA